MSAAQHRMVVNFTVAIVVEPDDDQFHAFCPALKGLHVGGRTEEEAVKNAIDGAIIYLQSLVSHGDPIPVGITVEHVLTNHSESHKGAHAHTRSLAVSLT